jgi:hypothetical protein
MHGSARAVATLAMRGLHGATFTARPLDQSRISSNAGAISRCSYIA